MKGSTLLLVLIVLLTGGLALWFLTKSQSRVGYGGGVSNTGTGSPWDVVNPWRLFASNAGIKSSAIDRNLATIQAVGNAAPGLINGISGLFGSIGGLFKSSAPTFKTSGTFSSPASAATTPGFIGQYDAPDYNIASADDYFYA